MKKAKILATILSCTMLLSAAFAMQAAAEPETAPEYVDVVKDGSFPNGTTAWESVDDEGKAIAAEKAVKIENNKAVFTADNQNWLHFVQTVSVKANTTYKLKLTCNLTAGNFRLDNVVIGENERPATWYGADTGKEYGTEYTFEIDVATGDRTEIKLDLRNNTGANVQAVGEINKIELIELDADGNPVEVPAEEPGTDPEEPGTEEPGTEEPGTEPEDQPAIGAGTIFPAENATWKSVDDEGKEVAADKAVKIENGKAVFTKDTADWLHFVQPVTVKANTTYTMKITCKLTAGELRLDNVVTGEPEYPATWYKNGEFAYGTEQTFEIKIETGDRTQLKIDLRNRGGEEKAIGEISKIELIELGNDGKPVENPETGVIFPVAALCVALSSAGALYISKKKK